MRQARFALPLASGLGLMVFMLACGGSSATTNGTVPVPPPPTPVGDVAMLLTDAPSDGWSKVEVTVTAITLRNQADPTKVETVFSGSAVVDLVDLDSIGELLGKATIPVGTYDRLELTLDLTPANIHLVDSDGIAVPSSRIIIGQSFQANGGKVPVTLNPPLTILQGQTSVAQVDFDLAHPLSLFQDPAGNVIFDVRMVHRPVTALTRLQFRHMRGVIKSVGATSFVFTNLHGKDLTFNFDPTTWYWDVDAKASGSVAGLVAGKFALIDLNMQNDGSLFARRIYYATDATKLPQMTPEGHILSINTTTNRIWVSTPEGTGQSPDGLRRAKVIAIDPDPTTGTQFVFETGTSLGIGSTGLATLRPGYKISLEVRDPLAIPMVANRINVQRAYDEGTFSAVNATSFTFGSQASARNYGYSLTPAFTWWPFADPTAAQATVAGFVTASQAGMAAGHAFGATSLTWNDTNKAWDSKDMILMPERLPAGTISSAYATGTKTMVVSFTTSAIPTPTLQPVVLADTGAVQTVVIKIRNQNGVISTSLVPAGNWAAELTTAVTRVNVSVMPQSDGSLKAFTIVAYTAN